MNYIHFQRKSKILIEKLPELEDFQKSLILNNWIEFIVHLEQRTNLNYRIYLTLTIFSIVGGISIPAINSLSFFSDNWIDWLITIIGIITAVSISLNASLKFNEKWRHFRRLAEYARIEGENYFSLIDKLYDGKTYQESFPIFMRRLGEIKELEINLYFESIKNKSQDKND